MAIGKLSAVTLLLLLYGCNLICLSRGCHNYQRSCHPHGTVRLTGYQEGRVEYCYNNFWRVLTDFTQWTDADAKVVCRQLGYPSSGAVSANYGGPSYCQQHIHMNIACTGTELRLDQCSTSQSSTHIYAGVRCLEASCTSGSVRLVGSSGQQGRVEVCLNSNWGTVCDSEWSTVDANIVCRQLGYSNADATTAYFGQGSGSILLNSVGCSGSESRLIDCSYSTYTGGCSHSDDAGVQCQSRCSHGSIRVVDGSNSQEGRVEVCLNGLWGTVCDDSWGQVDANVVCRQLGYSNADAAAYISAYFGQGIIPILLTNVACSGTESSLITCSYSSSTGNCNHNEDAGVRCQYRCSHGSIRVVGGSNSQEGRVEVCLNGLWGTVCDDYWGQVDANVVCRQLGYSNADASAFSSAYFGQGIVPILLDDVGCSGSESRFIDCPYSGHTADCGHHEDAGVRCQSACTHGSVRLRGSSAVYQGRVEVCLNGLWGTVCDDNWNTADARVACRKVGYPVPNPTVYTNAAFGQGNLPILLDDVACSGSELTLTSCTYDSNTNDCNHSEDAGVRCQYVPSTVSVGTALTSSIGAGSINYYQYSFPSNGITITLNVGTGIINCYASDRFQNPNEERYDWKIVVSGYSDVFIDPSLLDRTPGSNLYVGLQGVESSNTFTLDSATGDMRAPQAVTSNSAVTDTLGAGQRSYYEFAFDADGVTLRLTVTTGTMVCYASDLIQNPNEEQGYVWKVTTSSYIDVFLDPSSLTRAAGSSLYVGLEGADTSNNFSLNSTTGDQRVPESVDVDEEILGSLNNNELKYFQLPFPSAGITFYLTVSIGRIICYASVTVQNPNEEQGYEWKVETNSSAEVFLDPDTLDGEPGMYVYIGSEGGSSVNNFSLNSTSGDKRSPVAVSTNSTSMDTIEEGKRVYFQFPFPTDGVTIQLNITTGSVICYASDRYQNPNEAQGYDWKVEVSGYADVFLDPSLLSRSAGAIVYVGIEGVSVSNTFTLGNTEGDRREPATPNTGEVSTGSVVQGERLFFRLLFPLDGLTIQLTATSGRVVCYASDRIRNPTGTQGYDWRVETDGYTDVFIDPILLDRDPGQYIYVAIEGIQTDNNFSLNSTQGDHRVPFEASLGVSVASTLIYQEVVYYRFSLPSNGLTLVLDISYGSVVCYASSTIRNPNRKHGYSWRVEASYFNDSYIDPSTIEGTVGGYIYVGIEGSSNDSNNTFSLNGTSGDSATKVPDPPSNVQSLHITTTSAKLAWEAPVSLLNTPISDVERYELMVYEDQHNLPTIFANTTELHYMFTGLEEYINYTFEVAAVNRVGQGVYSIVFNFLTLQAAPSGPPQSVTGGAVSTTLITLQWLLPTAIDVNGIITKYAVNVKEVYTERMYNFFTENMHINVGPLHPYYIYECSVAAHTIATGVFSSSINVTTLEAEPTGPPLNLTDTEIGSRSVSLTWKPPQFDLQNGRIRQYLIRVTHNLTGLTYTVVSYSNQHLLQNLFPFHTYMFEVAAETVGLGPYTSQLTVTLLEDAPDAAPESVSGYAINSTSIFLGWEPPPDDTHNGIIRGYQINCTEANTGVSFNVTSELTEIIVSSLHPAYMYTCKVSAVTVESGVFSGNITVQTEEAAPSGPPLNLSSVTISSRSILLSWDLPLPEDRNGEITRYTVSVTNTETGETNELSTAETSLTVGSLTPYKNYYFAVAASTSAGHGPSTLAIYVTTPEDVPYEPQSPSANTVSGSPRELLVSWEFPLEPNGIITSYKVYCYETDSSRSGSGDVELTPHTEESIINATTTVASGSATEAIVAGLTPYTYYNCYVTANTTVGEGNASSSVTARTDESAPATPPESLSASANDANSITVAWSDPDIPYGIIVSYTVSYNISENLTSFVTESDHVTLESLDEYTVYEINVSASTRVGAGPSAQVYERTGQAKPHSPPTSIQIPSTDKRAATISWQPPVPEDRNGIITFYVLVIRNLQFDVDDITVNVSGSELSYRVSGLEEYSQHECQVAAGTLIGSGPYSSRVEFVTEQDAPSASPLSLSGSAQSTTLIDLTWDPPPAIDTNGVIQYYSIRVLESETSRSWSFVHVEPEISVGSLHPYYNYKCQVAAYTVDVGPYTNITMVQTHEAVPTSAPLDLRAVATGTHSLILSWEQPPLEHRNGRVRLYEVRLKEIETGDILQLESNTTHVNVSNLHPFYEYNCSVAAVTIGVGPFSEYLPIQLDEYSPSAAPLNLTGQVVDSTTITLSWSAPSSENQNGIVRKYIIRAIETDTGSEYTWESIATNIMIHSLHPYYTYQFTVAAYTVQQGPFSYIVTLQTSQDVPSEPPRNVTIEDVLSRSFTLNWQPPSDGHRNGIITEYIISLIDLETGNVTQLSTTDISIFITSLTPFTIYEVTVAAHTTGGRGPFSAINTVQTDESAPNTSPGDFGVTVLSSTTLELSWTPPSTEDRNGVIREYRVNITEVETARLLTYSTAMSSIRLQSLHPFYTYRCSVSAFTVATGPFSDISEVMMPQDVPSGYPQIFGIVPTESRTVNFQWEPPLTEEQNGIIIAYTVRQTTVVTGDLIEYTIANTTNLTLTNLTPYTAYAWKIAASTIVGMGPYSTTVNDITPEDAPTGAPQNLSGVSTSSQSVYLTWNLPVTMSHNGIIREYHVNVTDTQTGELMQLISGSTEIEVTNLHPYYNYELRVSAYTVALGPLSERYSIRTMEDAPSGAPLNIVAEANSSQSILVQWDPPPLQQQNGVLTGYTVNITQIAGEQRFHFQTTEQSLYVEGLTPHTTYECIIAAMTRVGTGPFSGIFTLQTFEEAPSGLPSNSSGVALNSTYILLTWDPPPLNQTHGDIQEYRITIVEYETDNTTLYSSEYTELVVGPLHPYYTYNCSIQAVTVEPGPPIIIIVRTLEAAPSSPPTSFEASVINTTAIHLSWEPPPPQHQNGIIRQYLIELSTPELDNNITIVSTRRSVTITNLHPYTLYECTVAAQTLGVGTRSGVEMARTHEAAPTAAPDELFIFVTSPTEIEIAWHPPRFEDSNGMIRAYIINITEINTGDTWQLTIDDDIDATIESLHPSYSYSISVAAQTVALGPFSNPVIVEMQEDAPSSPPTEVSTSGTTSVGFALSWSHPPDVDWNGQIRHFLINITEENTGLEYQLTTVANEIEVNFLHPFYTYSCSVAAVTILSGPYSPPISLTTLSAAPTGPPQNIYASEVEGSSLTLSWDPPLASEQNGIIAGYIINMTTDTGDRLEFIASTNTYTISDLEPYRVYHFVLAAETVSGQGPFSSPVPIRTGETDPTAPPDSLIIESIGSNYAELRWNAPDSSEHNGVIRFYKVFVTEEETGSNFTLTATNTRITATNLHPFYTYNVSVAAVTISPGPYSTQLSFTTMQDVPSASPGEVEGEALSPSSLVLTWQPPPEDQLNGVLTGYLVNVTETETGVQYQISADTSQYTIGRLHPFYRYSFIVAAITIGPGPFSGIFTIQMPQDAPTAPPRDIEGTVFNSSALSISWRPPPFNSRNGIIVGYTIRLLERVTSNVRTIETDGPNTEIFVTSLHPYYAYEFTVAAQTVAVGPFSPISTIRTDEDVPTAAPDNVTATPLDSMTIELVWEPPPIHSHNGIIRQYYIDIYVSETRENIFKVMSDNSTSTAVTELHPYYTYSFKVAAVTTAAGPQSTEVTARTLENVPTGAPQSVEAVAVSSSSIRVTWIPPLPEQQNGVIRSYHISVTTSEDGESMMNFETNGLTTIFILNSLHSYYLHHIKIAAFTVALGPYATVNERTHPDVPTGAPENLTVVAMSSSTVEVSWDPPQPEKQNGPLSEYILVVAGIDSDEEYELRPSPEANEITISSLHPFYTYTYTIATVTTGVGPYSPAVSFQMPEEVCMASVEAVSVEVESASSVTVSWLPPDSQFWNGIVTSYTVVYKLMGRVDVQDNNMAPISSQTFSIPQAGMPLVNNPDPRIVTSPLQFESVVINSLEEFYVYRFTVFLENSVGQSDTSSSITVEMPASAPSGPPTSLTASALSSTSILITWQNPDEFDSNGIITTFEIVLTDSTDNIRHFTLPASIYLFHLESLKKFEVYTVEVSAQNAQGEGPLSDPISVRTLEDVPSAPVDISVELLNSTAVTLKWSPPFSPNGNILYYKITYYGYKASEDDPKDVGEIIDKTRSVTVSELVAVIAGLQPGLTYNFEVRANTSAGFGEETVATFLLISKTGTSETESTDASTPVIAVLAILAGLALIVLVALVAVFILRRFYGNKKLMLNGIHFKNPGTRAEDDVDTGINLTSYRPSNEYEEREHKQNADDKKEHLGSYPSKGSGESSALKADTNM